MLWAELRILLRFPVTAVQAYNFPNESFAVVVEIEVCNLWGAPDAIQGVTKLKSRVALRACKDSVEGKHK